MKKEESIWSTDTDRSILRKIFHRNSISNCNYTSVQIKKLSKKKIWEKRRGINLSKNEVSNQLEDLLCNRRTRRYISNKTIDIDTISKLLQFCAGITDVKNGYFSYPSPGALYPTTLFLSIEINNLNNWIYRYNPYEHKLEEYLKISNNICDIIIDKELKIFPVKIFFTSDYQLIEDKYGEMAYRLLNQEIGHIAQNISLYSESIGLNTVCIGGFYEDEFKKIIPDYDLLYVMVVG